MRKRECTSKILKRLMVLLLCMLLFLSDNTITVLATEINEFTEEDSIDLSDNVDTLDVFPENESRQGSVDYNTIDGISSFEESMDIEEIIDDYPIEDEIIECDLEQIEAFNASAAVNGNAVASEALSYLNKLPYVSGGISLVTGADCGGFICAIYDKFGYNIWPYRTSMYSNRDKIGTNLGTDVSKAQAGDIVIYSGHVAIYTGNNKVVHMPGTGRKCSEAGVGMGGLTLKAIVRPYCIDNNAPIVPTPTYAAPVITSAQVYDANSSAGYYTVVANITAEAGLNRVQFPTWTRNNGQDDLVGNWGTNSAVSGRIISFGNNTYQATYTVYKSDHNNESDYYTTHIYAYDNQGKSTAYVVPDVNLNKPLKITDIRITNKNLTVGKYTIEVYFEDFKNVDRVLFPTWTNKNGKDDLDSNWSTNNAYKGTLKDYTKRAIYEVNIDDHNNERGIYITDIYAYDKFGRYVTERVPLVNMTAATSGKWYDNIEWELSEDGTLYLRGKGYISGDGTVRSDENPYTLFPWSPHINSVKKIVIEEGITDIGAGAFCKAENLTSLEMPTTLEVIQKYAFADCKALTGTLVLPSTLRKVYHSAFQGTGIDKIIFVGNSDSIPNFNQIEDNPEYSSITLHGIKEESYDRTVPWTFSFTQVREMAQSYYDDLGWWNMYTSIFLGPAGSFPHTAGIVFPSSMKELLQNDELYENESNTYKGYAISYDDVDLIFGDTGSGLLDSIGGNIFASEVKLDQDSLVFDVGEPAKKLTATVYPEDATDKNIKWISADTNIAIVDNEGNVTPVSEGETSIFALGGSAETVDEGTRLVAVCKVRVGGFEKDKSITVLQDKYEVAVGHTDPILFVMEGGDINVTFRSDNESIVTVDENGILTGVKAGIATVHVCYEIKGKNYDIACTAFVKDVVKSIEFDKQNINMVTGEKTTVGASLLPKNTRNSELLWTSSDWTIAQVDNYGNVSAISEGTVTITATSRDDLSTASASCLVNISKNISFSDDYERLNEKIEYGDASMAMEGIWIVGIEDKTYTGSSITQNIRVYDRTTLLKEKKDYIVSYKNNKAAANASDIKAPSVTIKMKGNYSGKKTFYFNINKADISSNENIIIKDIILAYNPNKTQYAVPLISYGKIKLRKGTDFILQYPAIGMGAYRNEGEYEIKIEGNGNYQGNVTVKEKISSKKNLSAAKVGNIGKLHYNSNGVKPKPSVSYKGITEPLVYGIDYELEWNNYDKIGVASVTIRAKEDSEYIGSKTVTYNIVGDSISKATVSNLPMSVVYTGNAYDADKCTLYYNGEPLEYNTDYTVEYLNNVNKGKATVIFVGKNNYTGVLKKSVVINSKSLNSSDISIDEIGTVPYAKGETVPKPVVKDGNRVLVEKVDYTLKYSNNKTVNGINTPKVTIIGKGNYSDSVIKEFKIVPADIGALSVIADNKQYVKKANSYIQKPVIVDLNGKKLAEKIDYTITCEILGQKDQYDTAPLGSIIKMTVSGCNVYKGTNVVYYTIVDDSIAATEISIQEKTHTGNSIQLEKEDIKVSISKDNDTKTLILGKDYEIASYSKNISMGTATVELRGIGSFTGRKKATFKVKAKDLQEYFTGSF